MSEMDLRVSMGCLKDEICALKRVQESYGKMEQEKLLIEKEILEMLKRILEKL